jgi:hypothetical protein
MNQLTAFNDLMSSQPTPLAPAMTPISRSRTESDGVVTITLKHTDRGRVHDESIVVSVIELRRYRTTRIGPVQQPDGVWVAHVSYFEDDEIYDDHDATAHGDFDRDDFDCRR